ncbi:Multidrug resistance-associated ABC transporter protein [Mycena sanguinolenta]|uniref:Multidrug resistance-associated ABC transporter protein n=1 Tax=Mycena sanguinolenta TaxID=230812 RepID=A0A8H6XHC3_9AGAR|nr:Multidrug resistance-associated ABC transporter protein [Mycena sanguinolenta]
MDFAYVPSIDSGQVLLLLPACATAISAAILLFRFVLSLKPVNESLARLGVLRPTENIPIPGIGTGLILGFRVARLLSDTSLYTLSVHFGSGFAIRQSPKDSSWTDPTRKLRVVSCLLHLRLPSHHSSVYPRQYIPVDPLNPQAVLNPEQTASIFSFAFYFFLDRIIFLAYRESQLQEDELYPLCDTDAAAHLQQRSFKYMDVFSGGKAPRHLFFGLMRVFYREFIILAFLLVFRVFTNYSGPYAMNQLLLYIETRDDPDTHIVVRPWVWIGLIFLGPIAGAFAFQTYIFINTRTLVRIESIITQLVFAHSLRIRVKAETTQANDASGDSAPPAVEVSPQTGSDTESTAETPTPGNAGSSARSEDDSASTTMQASSSSIKSTSTASKLQRKPAAVEPPQTPTEEIWGKSADSRDFLILLISVPLQLAIGIYFLYVLLGWAVWVGVASILLLAPVPGYMANLVRRFQKERLKRTDERVQSVTEAVNVLRMIKLFGWEENMKTRIGDKRNEELVWIRKRRFIDLVNGLVNFLIPVITMTVTYATYTLIMGQPLNASKVFSSMTVFDLFAVCTVTVAIYPCVRGYCSCSPENSVSIAQITGWLNNLMTGKVSLDRVNDFLKTTELLDAFDDRETAVVSTSDSPLDERIGFRNVIFTWSNGSNGSLPRSQRQFQFKVDDELLFQRDRINLVIGPTGSGKTSLLMALLGEMHFLPLSSDSWYNLPRNSGVAYAAQESWVLNDTIRSNIVFDTIFDEERYRKVLYQCALEPDLKLFQAGDQTEVGEKGLTLSGGQKARLTLARAVYSNAGILLLDDVLAALDVHTAQWIVEKCFGGDLIQNRTVILVTHNVALTRPIADFVVSFSADGRIQSQGTISEITQRGPLVAQIHRDQQALDKKQQEVDAEALVAEPAQGKLILAEEVELGHVSSSSLTMYFSAMGGKHPVFFFVFYFGGSFFQQIFITLRSWQLGNWANQYDDRPAEEVDVVFNLSVFVAIVFISTSSFCIVFLYLVFGQLRASRVIHKTLINSVLGAPLRWLDVTPTSRIIARVTNDVRAVDDSLANQFFPLTALIVSMLTKFAAVIIYAPIFFFPGVFVGALGAWVGQIYISGQLPVKRFMSNTRAPVLAHFGAAIAGLVSVRAFGAQSKFTTESMSRIDRYTRAARNFYNLNRWVSIRIDILGAMFSASVATYMVYITRSRAGDAGFVLNMAISFTQILLYVVRLINDFEVQGNSLERIQGYINIEHEKPATEAGKPPAYWPASGELRVENLSARYSPDGPKVLHDVSFHIKAGERIGIVGRTGSGKSSLTLALLGCIPTEGSVRYDGLETSKLNLDALRSSITIIPQVPELLSGSLRANLDPFGQYDDAELNYALRAAGLFALQSEIDEGRITLDSAISEGGSNLSVGQRQIFALARAIVRKSKILILDEATSAIDYKTDSIIQNSLREELRGDVSLLTVAHRLQTIMDADKIMVLDAGRLVEFDSPKKLLKIKDGRLRALVEESEDRDALYAMAGAE